MCARVYIPAVIAVTAVIAVVVLVGRDIPPRLTCIVVSRRASLVVLSGVHFKPHLRGFISCLCLLCVRGGAAVCVRGRVFFWVGGHHRPHRPHHLALHHFDPG